MSKKIEMRRFWIANKTEWLSKDEIQEAFGCDKDNAEDIWEQGEK